MPEPTPKGLREIEYAAAHVNAALAIGEAAIEMLLEGPDSHDPDVARAAKLVLNTQGKLLQHWMQTLKATLLRHHQNHENMELPPSHLSYAFRADEATKDYENHMTTMFPEICDERQPHTTDSAFYTFTIAMIATNRAVRRLAGEIASQEKGSPERLAYTEALLEIGTKADVKHPPAQNDALYNLAQMGDCDMDNERKKRFLKRAQDAADDTETLREMHQGEGPGEQEQDDAPWIHLAIITVTLPGMKAITGLDDARKLARDWDTKLMGENNALRDRGTQFIMDKFQAGIEVIPAGEERPASSMITVVPEDQDDSLTMELEHTSNLVEMAISRGRREDDGQESGTVLKTRMCLSTNRIPDGYGDSRLNKPLSYPFLTPSGHRCLDTITWERNDEMEQEILQDHRDVVNSYLVWSESMTTVPEKTTSTDLLEIMMATYTLGARFLLQDLAEYLTEDPTEEPQGG